MNINHFETSTDSATTAVFGSREMLEPAPVDKIPEHPTTPEIA